MSGRGKRDRWVWSLFLYCPQEELFSYCNRPRRTITEVLADFASAAAAVPFSYLFDLIPPLQPRAFSIASAPEVGNGDQESYLLHLLLLLLLFSSSSFSSFFSSSSSSSAGSP